MSKCTDLSECGGGHGELHPCGTLDFIEAFFIFTLVTGDAPGGEVRAGRAHALQMSRVMLLLLLSLLVGNTSVGSVFAVRAAAPGPT